MDDCHFGSVTKFLKQTLMSMQLLADCQIQKGTKTCKKAESYPASSISRDDIIPALNKQNKKMVSVCGECKNLQGSSVWTWWHQIALEIYKQDRSWQLMTDKNTQSMKLRQAFEIDLQYLLWRQHPNPNPQAWIPEKKKPKQGFQYSPTIAEVWNHSWKSQNKKNVRIRGTQSTTWYLSTQQTCAKTPLRKQ